MKRFIIALMFIICFSIFSFKNTYALDDFVFDIDSTDTFPLTLCGNPASNDYPSCFDYSYVKFEPVNNVSGSLSVNNSVFTVSGLYGTRIPNFTTSLYSLTPVSGLTMQSFPSYLTSLKVTFTNSVSSCNCPEVEEPDCPDPEENSAFINVVLDAFWKYQKAFAGAIVAIIVIFIVYRLIKGVLR